MHHQSIDNTMLLTTLLDPTLRCRSPFFIPFIGRSGSTLLVNLLNQHPQISCLEEVLNPRFIVRPTSIRHHLKRAIGRKLFMAYALRRVYGFNGDNFEAQGFKLKVRKGKDLDHFPEVMDFFERHRDRMKCIYLHRENHLRGAISEQNYRRVKKRFGDANIRVDQKHAQMEKIEINVDLAIQRTRERELDEERILSLTRDRFSFISVKYEDLIAEQTQTLDKIAAFLDVIPFSKFTVTARTSQISEKKLEDYVENAEELCDALMAEGMHSYVKMNFSN